mgnify:CR=1 FL=1|jgi:hypothetical protein
MLKLPFVFVKGDREIHKVLGVFYIIDFVHLSFQALEETSPAQESFDVEE